ncbi:olfactory receptor 2AG2-like [Ambystoma mexicanum]|uniref:olfactory receptor 2AG2-like n=1 Tax=Ambystoma mexicanum TaxID=8296 RepID=UPI0037E8433A
MPSPLTLQLDNINTNTPSAAAELTATSTSDKNLLAVYSPLAVGILGPSLLICLLTGAGWLFLLRRHRSFAGKARFLLLVCTTLSHTSYFGVTLLRFLLLLCGVAISQPLCACLLLLQNYSLFVELVTLDALCLDRYLAVCRPLSYESIFSQENVYKVLLVVFLIPLVPPVSLALLHVLDGKDGSIALLCNVDSLDTNPFLMYWRVTMNLVYFLPSLAAISFFYVLVLWQGLPSRPAVPSGPQAQKVLLLHLIQLGFYLLPILPIIVLSPLQSRGLVGERAVFWIKNVLFVFFTIGQVMGPIVHGLRSEEIRRCITRHLGWRRGTVVPLSI